MTKITIDNRDLKNVHIDTYQMLKGDSWNESELEYYNEQSNVELDYDDLTWDYNHRAIVTAFAKESINLILQGVKHENGGECIKDINYIASTSPRFYNYTTDSYTMAVEVDVEKLQEYTHKHNREIVAIAEGYDQAIMDGIISKGSMQHAAVCHIINNAIVKDDYNMAMWEVESKVYQENTTITKPS